MTPEVASISAARQRAHKRMLIMRGMKEAGYGWEDAFVRLRREGLIDCRSPSSKDGHRTAIRFFWFPNGARR